MFYDPEFMTANEVGLKSDWRLGGVAMRLNGSYYDSDYKDVQFSTLTQNPITQQFETTITNRAQATIKGYNISFQIVPVRGLRISYAYAHFKNIYKIQPLSFPAPATSPFRCFTTPYAYCADVPIAGPHNTYTLQVGYTLPLDESVGTVSLNADYYHQDANTSINSSTGLVTTQPIYDTLNASASWRDVLGKGFDVTVWGRNLGDKNASYINNSLATSVFSTRTAIYRLEPRTYGLTIRYAWE